MENRTRDHFILGEFAICWKIAVETRRLWPNYGRKGGQFTTVVTFGLGRYLYYFSGEWVDLDERKRPKSVPKLPKWATPDGWKQGLRPGLELGTSPPKPATSRDRTGNNTPQQRGQGDPTALVREIEALAEPLGKGLYRGLLKTVARVWRPNDVCDVTLLKTILTCMQGAQRGLQRLDAALCITGPEALDPIFKAIKVRSLDKVDNLETLKKIVLALEESAAKARR